jgi:choline dehydrogenase-like flavoprotein
MIEDISGNVSERADACVVGSGAAGSVIAFELAKEGKSVVVLDRGGYYKVTDFDGMTELELLQLWKNGSAQVARASIDAFPVSVAQGECVGGSTVLNYGICFRTPPQVLERWTNEFGVQGISPDEMAPYFSELEQALSVAKVSRAGTVHEVFKKGCETLGFHGDWMSRNCRDCSSKQSALVAYLKWADDKGTRIYPNCVVGKVVVRNGKAAGVEGRIFNPSDKKAHKFRANSKVVILCAGAIGSSEILLKNNLANSSGLVGRYVSLHPSPAIVAEFEQEVKGHEDLPMSYYCDEFGITRQGRAGFVMESIFLPPAQLAVVLPSLGFRHKELMKSYTHYAAAGILVQDEPGGNVTLNWGKEAVIEYRLGDREKELMKQGMTAAARAFFAAGAKSVITSHVEETVLRSERDLDLIERKPIVPGSIALVSAHPQGGNRLGSDPQRSVVNSMCESHDVPRLFVCDASVFPTSVGVNPQISIMALALRTARYVNQNGSRYFA